MLNGKKLQFLRVQKDLSQVYIANCIGVSERWIGKVENEGESPSQETYDKWILALYGGLKPQKKVIAEKPVVKSSTKKK